MGGQTSAEIAGQVADLVAVEAQVQTFDLVVEESQAERRNLAGQTLTQVVEAGQAGLVFDSFAQVEVEGPSDLCEVEDLLVLVGVAYLLTLAVVVDFDGHQAVLGVVVVQAEIIIQVGPIPVLVVLENQVAWACWTVVANQVFQAVVVSQVVLDAVVSYFDQAVVVVQTVEVDQTDQSREVSQTAWAALDGAVDQVEAVNQVALAWAQP